MTLIYEDDLGIVHTRIPKMKFLYQNIQELEYEPDRQTDTHRHATEHITTVGGNYGNQTAQTEPER